jgi:hypothetical protein
LDQFKDEFYLFKPKKFDILGLGLGLGLGFFGFLGLDLGLDFGFFENPTQIQIPTFLGSSDWGGG